MVQKRLGSTRIHHVLPAMLAVSLGGCGGMGGCSAVKPLPEGGVPGYQTIEGGGQIRVTAAGLTKLTSIIPGLINSGISRGFCVPKTDFGLGNICSRDTPTKNATCTPGCRVGVSLHPGSFSVSAQNASTLRIAAGLDIQSDVYLKVGTDNAYIDCEDLTVSGQNVAITADLALGTAPGDGALTLDVGGVTFATGSLKFKGCSIIGSAFNVLANLFAPQVNKWVVAEIAPRLKDALRDFLPSPLGLQGMLDVSGLIGTTTRGPALLETRLVAGGYASLAGSGINVGFITGVNSDADPSTREPGARADRTPFASEPHRCVPPIPVDNLTAPPHSLPPVQRSGITNGPPVALMPAGEFVGMPEAGGDVVVGLSQTALSLFGHHLVTSGALCLGIGTGPSLPSLELSDFNILLPSIAALQSKEGSDPVLIIGRPQRPIGIVVGNNTADSPALTAQISHFEIDLYGFLYQRYVRLLTLDFTADIGVNLVFEAPPGSGATIKPVLVGISRDTVVAKVINSEFIKETPAEIEALLPTLLDIVVQRIGNIRPIAVPPFAGFTLADLSLRRAATTQDSFLAINATLTPGSAARLLAAQDPFAAEAVAALDAQVSAPQPRSTGHAQLIDVTTPSASHIRDALARTANGALPSVTLDVDRFDHSTGTPRELEWSWNINGGMWHDYQSASPLVISDRAFAVQGTYTIGLQSRVKGDYRTVSDVTETEVVIDSVGPHVFTDDVTWTDGAITVSVRDAVSGKDVRVAFGTPGADAPATEWRREADASLSRALFDRLQAGGEVVVFARDAVGNETVALVAPRGDFTAASGCGCQSSGRPGAGALILVGVIGIVLLRRRQPRGLARPRRWRIAIDHVGAIAALTALVPVGCNSGNKTRCEVAADCTDCGDQHAFCIDQTCICADSVPLGHVGPYSDLAVGPNGDIWISAYAQSHGDLVVAKTTGGRIPDGDWKWIDGVPDGPVVVADTKIRGGIEDAGPDVGMYTSIAVSPAGVPMVTYFDVDRGTLRFATTANGAWQVSDIDIGTGDIDSPGGSAVGMFTSLTLRADDGQPGVAYLAHVRDAAGIRAEVRYAAAQTDSPTQPSDWQTWVVDTGVVPPTDADHPNFYPLPQGLGLFIDSARNPTNQAPVVAYYDRGRAQLKVAKFNPSTNAFDAPIALAGSGGVDAGWSPSLQVDDAGTVHVAYVNATDHDLWYLVEGNAPEIIDDGLRIVGPTVDDLPKPEFHFVGDDANLLIRSDRDPLVVYQDATTHELMLARRHSRGWDHTSIAGGTTAAEWTGAYGFFASAAMSGTALFMSSWVIDQPINDNWVEVFRYVIAE